MRQTCYLAVCAALCSLSSGCTQAPSSICEMSQSRHFWQGLDIEWQGQIIDIQARHGGGIYFTALPCGDVISLDPMTVPSLFSSSYDADGHTAVADFEVKGRLTFQDGRVVLRPSSIRQTSPWQTGQNGGFDAYMQKRIEAWRRDSRRPNDS